jgi:prevent-host-death family protein
MPTTYTTYEAKAKFSEIMRKVRKGERVIVSYHGRDVAEIRPVEESRPLAAALRELEDEGILSPARPKPRDPAPLVRRPGALQRFLESRE